MLATLDLVKSIEKWAKSSWRRISALLLSLWRCRSVGPIAKMKGCFWLEKEILPSYSESLFPPWRLESLGEGKVRLAMDLQWMFAM